MMSFKLLPYLPGFIFGSAESVGDCVSVPAPCLPGVPRVRLTSCLASAAVFILLIILSHEISSLQVGFSLIFVFLLLNA